MFSARLPSQHRHRDPRTIDRILRLALFHKTFNRSQENSHQPVAAIALCAFDTSSDSLGFGETEFHIDCGIRQEIFGLAMTFLSQK